MDLQLCIGSTPKLDLELSDTILKYGFHQLRRDDSAIREAALPPLIA